MNNEVSELQRVLLGLAAQVGRTSRHRIGTVTERDAGKFHATVQGAVIGGDSRPTGSSPHPLLASSVLAWGDGPAEPDLMPDGNSRDTFAGLELGSLRLMGGGQELTFHRAVELDVDLQMEVSLENVELKHGKSGDFLALRLRREFSDSAGEAYVTCRETFLARE